MTAAPAAPITSPRTQPRIEHLFLSGYSLDMIAEQGVKGGWSRRDAEVVAEVNGWELDRSGRIPREHRHASPTPEPRPAPVAVAPAPAPQIALPRELAALIEGRKHPVPRIKRRADTIHAQLVKLADDMDTADEEKQVRERLAELDAERERLRAQLRRKVTPEQAVAARGDKPILHGTWGGYLMESRRGVDHCAPCEAAKQRAQDARLAAKT